MITCASLDKLCVPGSHCVTYPNWSQCQEDDIVSPGPGCFATNNGPNPGQRWGCTTDSDCCNPEAVCGSDKLCLLPTTCPTGLGPTIKWEDLSLDARRLVSDELKKTKTNLRKA